jgi:hypothetical protein
MGAGAGFGLLAQAPRLSDAAATATIAITLIMVILGSPPFRQLARLNLTQPPRGTTKNAEKIIGCFF